MGSVMPGLAERNRCPSFGERPHLMSGTVAFPAEHALKADYVLTCWDCKLRMVVGKVMEWTSLNGTPAQANEPTLAGLIRGKKG